LQGFLSTTKAIKNKKIQISSWILRPVISFFMMDAEELHLEEKKTL